MFTVSSMPHVGGATTMKMIVTFNHLTKIYKYVTQVVNGVAGFIGVNEVAGLI